MVLQDSRVSCGTICTPGCPRSKTCAIEFALADMESWGIITKIKEGKPTAWVNILVYCRKLNDKLRICLDPKGLNRGHFQRALCHHYSGRNSPKAKWCQVLLHCWCKMWLLERCAKPGIKLFLHMPFGLKMSQDIFQAKIDETFEKVARVPLWHFRKVRTGP